MGLQDRDYSRYQPAGFSRGNDAPSGSGYGWGDRSGGWQGSAGRSAVVMLLVINVAVFFLDLLLSGSARDQSGLIHSRMLEWFAVRGDTILYPWTWFRFLTYGFVHSLDDIRHLAFNMLGLFIFGRIVEQQIGRSEFWRFYLLAIVLGGIVATLQAALPAWLAGQSVPQIFTVGASGAVCAITILFAFMNPQATVLLFLVLPIKAWVLAIVFVVSNLMGMLGGQGNVAYGVHLAGIAWGAIYHLKQIKLDSIPLTSWRQTWQKLAARKPRLRLHDPERTLAEQEAEVDRLLDKIQAHGLDSLTSAERKKLERHSKLKRQQQNR